VGETKINSENKKVAAYIRVSTNLDSQENSYEAQERYFSHLLSENSEWISAGIYSDYGLSGTDGEKRPGFRRMIRHCREGKIDRIICKSISRFARNTSDFMTALRILRDYQVTILFEKEAMDTGSAVSDFMLTALGAVSQEESRSISENIRWGMRTRYPKGDVRNQQLYGYRYNGKTVRTRSDYEYKDIEIVEEEAEVVRSIFQMVSKGSHYTEIARKLNGQHIPAPVSDYTRKRKNKAVKGQLKSNIDEGWTAHHISQIIRRERYVGDVLVQKTYTTDYLSHRVRKNKGEVAQYLVKDHHPAIVSRELYENVQKIVKINEAWYGTRGENRRSRPFSGMLICAECGRYYHVRNSRKHPIWFCPSTALNNGNRICHSGKIYEEQLIQVVRQAFAQRFFPDKTKITKASIRHLSGHMEEAGWMDGVAKECLFIRRQVMLFQKINDSTRKWLDTCKNPGEYEAVAQRLAEDEEEEKRLLERIQYLESYEKETEKYFDDRKKAVGWMKGLVQKLHGTAEFMAGATGEYLKAFILSIKIEASIRYEIQWFDDMRTTVEIK
jgi:DNA invertase Pin-like site-specific DNA recombinase